MVFSGGKKTKQKMHLRKVGFLKGNRFSPQANLVKENTAKKTIYIPKKKISLKLSQRILGQEQGVRDLKDDYIIANTDCLEDLFYTGYTQHKLTKPLCKGMLTMVLREERLISRAYTLKCLKCDYTSDKDGIKLYRTTPSGGRPESTLNMALGHALLNSSIGPTGFREIMLRIGVQPGSETGLQNIVSNKANDSVVSLAEKNMLKVRKYLKRKCPEGVSLPNDGRYSTRQNMKTPFQAANQLVFTVTEDNTPEKKIVMLQCENKLCSKKNSGKQQDCKSHEGTCSANLKPEDPIGREERPASACAKRLKEEDMKVKSVTNDYDATVFPPFKELWPDAVNYKDPQHLSRILRTHIKAASFSKTMFTGNKVESTRKHNWFAEDLRQRCEAEVSSAIKKARSSGDSSLPAVANFLKETPNAIISCYQGQCNVCDEFSNCCSESKRWPRLFCRRSSNKKMNFVMEQQDIITLKNLINFRLGDKALSATFTGSSTQKVEAFNRSLSKYNPKTITCSKSFRGRAHAAALNVNAGFHGSSTELLRASHHTVSASVKIQIKKHSEAIAHRKKYQQSEKAKTKRIINRSYLYRLHEKKYQDKREDDFAYSKGQAVHQIDDRPAGASQDKVLSSASRPGPR